MDSFSKVWFIEEKKKKHKIRLPVTIWPNIHNRIDTESFYGVVFARNKNNGERVPC